jgi:hypothetical protein
MAAALRFVDILEVLSRHEVDLIVVGGVAAILEGAPVSTFDLDVVILRVKENHTQLLAALQETQRALSRPRWPTHRAGCRENGDDPDPSVADRFRASRYPRNRNRRADRTAA